jgi:hypothetical protein
MPLLLVYKRSAQGLKISPRGWSLDGRDVQWKGKVRKNPSGPRHGWPGRKRSLNGRRHG